jgi:MFS family permease
VSGTLGERFGRFRVLRTSLAVYLVSSILVAASPTLVLFLAARALQGAANAFFTPLLLAGLADVTVETRLGRRVGMYTSFQSVGGAAAPFAGGLAAEIDWRWAFWSTAAFTAVVLASMPRDAPRRAAIVPPVRGLLSGRLLALALASGAAAAGPLGAAVLVGFKIRDVLGLAASSAGLILAGGYAGAALLGPAFGRLLDRFGARRCGLVSLLGVAAVMAAMGPIDGRVAVTVLYGLVGSLIGFVTVVLHQAASVILPENRGGALSLVLSLRFFGLAVGPLVWVPVLDRSVTAAFIGSGLLAVVSLGALLLSLASTPVASEAWPARRTASRPRPGGRAR